MRVDKDVKYNHITQLVESAGVADACIYLELESAGDGVAMASMKAVRAILGVYDIMTLTANDLSRGTPGGRTAAKNNCHCCCHGDHQLLRRMTGGVACLGGGRKLVCSG